METIGEMECRLKINTNADEPQWDRYVEIVLRAHNTTYHTTIKC